MTTLLTDRNYAPKDPEFSAEGGEGSHFPSKLAPFQSEQDFLAALFDQGYTTEEIREAEADLANLTPPGRAAVVGKGVLGGLDSDLDEEIAKLVGKEQVNGVKRPLAEVAAELRQTPSPRSDNNHASTA